MTNRTRVTLGGALVLAVALVALVFLQRPPADRSGIRVGADITLTGAFGYFGQQLEKGLNLAGIEANRDTSQPPVELIIRDNRHDAFEAVAIFERLANQDNVSAAISMYSPMTKTIYAKAAEYGVPLVSTYTTARDITNDWTFRDFPGMDEQVPPLTQYAARALGLRRVSMVIFQADFARDGRDVFKKEFTAQGGSIIHSDEVPIANAVELMPDAIAKATVDNPDGVFLVLSAAPLGLAIKRLRETGYTGAILSVIMFDSPEVQDVAGEAANGVVYVSVPFDVDRSEEGRKFDERFRAAYGSAPDYMAVYGYTIGQYLLGAARKAGGDRRRTLEELKKLDVESIRGRITTQPNGNIQSPVQLFRFNHGKGTAISPFAAQSG